jgi:hypothetical protein
MRLELTGILVLCLALVAGCRKKDSELPPPSLDAQANEEIEKILRKFPNFRVVPLLHSGTTTAAFADSLIVDDIRGVQVDDDPPVLRGPAHTSPASMVDGFAAGQAPYYASGILPFDFDCFQNTNSYRGWHTWNMSEYLSCHGFNQTHVYNSTLDDWTHLPEGTEFYTWGWWDWNDWMTNNSLTPGRYDTLPDLAALTTTMLGESFFYATNAGPSAYAGSMADMEHGVLSPSSLQAQTWYPSGGTQAEKDRFEAAYYDGYANSNICWMHVAEQRGWSGYGIYGWQPFARQWFGLDTATGDPQSYWRWLRFGSRIYDEVEVIHPSIYVFYWNAKNLAYMLANIDLNNNVISEKAVQKPVRPWVWSLFHGGGPGWRWWKFQPIPDHEMQAQYAAVFFSKIDGIILYGWSGTSDHNRVTLSVDDDRLVESAFTAPELGAPAQTRDFVQYDVIHVTGIDVSDNVEFKYIDKADPAGSLAAPTTYVLPRATIEPMLRPETAGIDAMVEGMALARVFEFFLWHGELKIDVPATEQWDQSLPVVRRKKVGRYHVVVAYDPFFASYPSGRTVTLTDFDGVAGRNLVLPVDGVVRIWIFRG